MVMIPQQRKEMFPEPEMPMSRLESEAALAAGVIGLRQEIKTLVASIKEDQVKNQECFAALIAMLTKSLNEKPDAQI